MSENFHDAQRSGAGAHAHEDVAAWIADVNVENLVDELRRRSLGKPSRREFVHIGHDLLERAVYARRAEVEALVNAGEKA